MAFILFCNSLMVLKEMQHLYLSSDIPPYISTHTRKRPCFGGKGSPMSSQEILILKSNFHKPF